MCKQKVGLLDQEEKEFLSKKQYEDDKFFTPMQDSKNNWIIPLHQIFDNTNIDCWWVKYLPLIDYTPR